MNGADPSVLQRIASDPEHSVWVSASAGSGKTKVLIDRVLRLMLAETRPERILCITFTKAGAAEMAIRVNDTLGQWATIDDADLAAALEGLTGAPPEAETMERARRLFARVLDTPGRLRILTIHSFCQSLLGRFPVEARVPPHFNVIEERDSQALLREARDRVFLRAEEGNPLGRALEAATRYADEQRFEEQILKLCGERGRFARMLEQHGGLDGAVRSLFTDLRVDPRDSDAAILARASQEDAFDHGTLFATATALSQSTKKSDPPKARAMQDWLQQSVDQRVANFERYADVFLKIEDARGPRETVATKYLCDQVPWLREELDKEQKRMVAVEDHRRRQATAEATAALWRIAEATLAGYRNAKAARAQLDYEDLIQQTEALLKTGAGAASWVLYKLDGGLDHILVDEAQDTNRAQWAVIEALAQEFFAGEGARGERRTIFAVGDRKQSIFSFQGAEPDAFDEMRARFRDMVEGAARSWREVDLETSFRSTDAVLGAVDAVFADRQAAAGVVAADERLHHRVHRSGQGGLVELWPALIGRKLPDPAPWTLPLERDTVTVPLHRLAGILARRLGAMIGQTELTARGRTVRAGDIMVLVRRRNAFVEALVRALKAQGTPVAGVDRMVLSEQIAVMDLLAFARFLLLPEDDLTLACLLKSPLIGLDEDQLFSLAYDRATQSLWQRLGAAAETVPLLASARSWLEEQLSRADRVGPFELFARVLATACPAAATGRLAFAARLGAEAEDPINEFLSLTYGFEQSHAPSLQGFLAWFDAGQSEIKRDPEQAARDEIRIMTVHGAKGLQAPVVVLPDLKSKPDLKDVLFWRDGLVLWVPSARQRNSVTNPLRDARRERADEEYRRLLYVAMTRAEDHLILCGWRGEKKTPEGNWYDLVQAGMESLAGAERVEIEFEDAGDASWEGDGWRHVTSQRSAARADTDALARLPEPMDLPEWIDRPAPVEPQPPRPLAPSRPASADPPVRSPGGSANQAALRRGTLIHALLQHLPSLPADEWERAAELFLAEPLHRLDGPARAEIAAEVLAVLSHPDFAVLFGPGSRAEVAVTGLVPGPDGAPQAISGQVDRLCLRDDGLWIVDYKTMRPPPAAPEDAPVAYLRQMAAYRAVLAGIWPDRPVACALLWTEKPRLMGLPAALLDCHIPAT